MLRALAGLGIFADRADGRFEITPLAELLRRDAPESVRASAELSGSGATGRVPVVEKIIPPGNEAFAGKLTDTTMLLMTGWPRSDRVGVRPRSSRRRA